MDRTRRGIRACIGIDCVLGAQPALRAVAAGRIRIGATNAENRSAVAVAIRAAIALSQRSKGMLKPTLADLLKSRRAADGAKPVKRAADDRMGVGRTCVPQ